MDESFISELINRGYDLDKFLEPYAKKFAIPYKVGGNRDEEYVLHLIKGSLNETGLKNFGDGIIRNFAQYNKPVDGPEVQRKLNNTIIFLRSYYKAES